MKSESPGESDAAQRAQPVLAHPLHRLADRAHEPPFEIELPIKGIAQFLPLGVVRDGVDGEITTRQILVERCPEGAGSLTALPVIETKAGDVSAYIPTNVISITDGQVYLQDNLFKSGVRPAVDVGISVSRVGGAAQIKSMKSVAGTLKLDLAQFRELEAFATFGSELDAISKAQLERGYRLVELLKQPLNSPMSVEEQVVVVFAGTKGYLDSLPVADVRRFEKELLEHMRSTQGGLLASMRSNPKADVPAELGDLIASFKAQFVAASAAAKAADPTATSAAELGEAHSDKTLATE